MVRRIKLEFGGAEKKREVSQSSAFLPVLNRAMFDGKGGIQKNSRLERMSVDGCSNRLKNGWLWKMANTVIVSLTLRCPLSIQHTGQNEMRA